jgi:uncharacterized protein (TIGR02099 family)
LSEKLTEKIYHYFLFVIAIILVVSAIVFTVTRALTPFLNLHRSTFEKWTTQLVGAPVKVDRVAFGWHGIEPEMWLKDVTIYRPDGKKEILHVKNFYVALSLFRSIEYKKFLPSLITLSGVKISIHNLGDGKFKINDMTISNAAKDQASSINFKLAKAWLLEQSRIYLRGIRVNYYTQKKKLYPLDIKYVNLQSNDQFHQLDGKMRLLNKADTELHLIIQASGSVSNLDKLQATIYAKLTNVRLEQWLQSKAIAGYKVTNGMGGLQAWLNWNMGHWGKAQGKVNLFDIELKTAAEKTMQFKHLSSNVAWTPSQDGWQFSLSKLNLITKDYLWPSTQFLLKKKIKHNKTHWNAWLQFAEIGDVKKFIKNSTLINSKAKLWLSRLNPIGAIKNIGFKSEGELQNPSSYHAQGALEHVSYQAYKNIPGIENATAHFAFAKDQGDLNIDTKNAVLHYPSMFSSPLAIGQMKGNIRWKRTVAGGWQIVSKSLSASNNDLGLYTQFQLQLLPHQQPFVSLLGGYYVANPAVVKKYLPSGAIDKGTMTWLKQAFVGGKGLQGKMILRGNLKDFPFKDHQGVFQVDTKIKDIDLHYADGWPNINNIKADLLFANQKMVVSATQGSIYNTKLNKVKVVIPSLSAPGGSHLLVDGHLSGGASSLVRFIKESPLNATVGQVFEHSTLTGPTNLHIQLDIPLSQPDLTKVDGTVNFLNDKADFPSWYLNLDKLNGPLSFTSMSLSSKKITAIAYGHPVVVNLSTKKISPERSDVHIAFNGMLDAAYLKKQFKMLDQINFTGNATYNGDLIFHLGDKINVQNQLTVHSDLYGLNVSYPEPLGKDAKMLAPLSVNVTFGNDQESRLQFNYGKRVSGAFILPLINGSPSFYSGNIQLSKPASFTKFKGLTIGGAIASVDFAAWKKALALNTASDGDWKEWSASFAKILRVIDLHIKQFTAYGITLKPVEFRISHQSAKWFLTAISNPIQGLLGLPDNFPDSPITGKFQRIQIPQLSIKSNAKKSFNPGSIPPMVLSTNDFKYGTHDFGGVSFDVQPDNRTLKIKKLNLNSPLLSGKLSGAWRLNSNGKYNSALSGWLKSQNIQQLMAGWGIKRSKLIASTGVASFSLAWPDTIYKPTLNTISGDLGIKLGSGWIVGLNKATVEKLNLGKLLTLLSVRHLIFQLGDLSRNGYSFDSITADLHFNNGTITTSNLHAQGSVADIWAKGLVNLVKKTMDLKLAIVVNATSSIPVIATVASGFNPIVGIAAWVAEQIVHKAVTANIDYNYELIGPWKAPQVKKLH